MNIGFVNDFIKLTAVRATETGQIFIVPAFLYGAGNESVYKGFLKLYFVI